MSVEIMALGDSAIRISFGNEIEESTHHEIYRFLHNIMGYKIDGVIECVPTFTTIAIFYNPCKIRYSQLEKIVYSVMESAKETKPHTPIVYRIPVYYGEKTGPDLRFVAEYNHISELEVIQYHCNQEYLVHMIGFVPGFPYLGGLNKKISTPRLEIPRAKVAAGSVGIGGDQTGIYPVEVPSGWRIIGITPIPLFDIENNNPSLLSAGNYVSFFPVDIDEYLAIKEMAALKKYKVLTYKKGDSLP
ncbi:5-oxoprolinase subunit PxpB [Neobacillus sp. DY30]|uniref:5-oxoprolinase subunit PxpB n=1 Tax=Neobacillus sp. DY30 TaxID=3047871 RepID=UPI0024BFC286|nr:5-oxoprolinase subunit PxpB [Neobacillus sp. DY30]WHY02893.1 5-oxoprolinase subunit PxpB [Neobacillus sp. DY30]